MHNTRIKYGCVVMMLIIILIPKISFGQISGNIYFRFNSYAIQYKEQQKLNNLVLNWKQLKPGFTIIISGHCDSVGSDAFNDRLSLLRANSVYNYLIKNGLSHNTKYDIKGFGKRNPVNGNFSDGNMQANRMAHVEIIYNQSKKDRERKVENS